MANLSVMDSDTRKVRGERPYVFTDLLRQKGLADIIAFLENAGGLAASEKAMTA
jgi:urease accessory protein